MALAALTIMHKFTYEADLALTVESLSKSVAALESHASSLSDSILALQFKRNEIVRVAVESALPAINGKVLESLRASYPRFVDGPVEEAFRRNKPRFGLFKPKYYDQALDQIKVRLSHFLGSSSVLPEIERVDTEIFNLSEQQQDIQGRAASVLSVLRMLTDAQVKGSVLPEETKREVREMARRARDTQATGRQRRFAAFPSAPVSSQREVHVIHDTQSDDDLWLYYLTDIPTSMRTLILDSMHDHRRRESDVYTSPAPAMDVMPIAVPTEDNGFMSSPTSFDDVAPGSHTDIGGDYAGAVAAEAVVLSQSESIATDDSLGAFS